MSYIMEPGQAWAMLLARTWSGNAIPALPGGGTIQATLVLGIKKVAKVQRRLVVPPCIRRQRRGRALSQIRERLLETFCYTCAESSDGPRLGYPLVCQRGYVRLQPGAH